LGVGHSESEQNGGFQGAFAKKGKSSDARKTEKSAFRRSEAAKD
jgi:hypothetical protein